MKSWVRLAAAVVLALAAVDASAAVYAVPPSAAQAKRATRLEVTTRYTILDARASHRVVTLTVGCRRLAQRLYRCSFLATAATDLYTYIVQGKSMVRFEERKVAHAKLYGVSCSTYNSSNIPFDFGC
jgi:hypothetical protein